MIKTIVIEKKNLSDCLKSAKQYYGASDWKIYADDAGNVDLRHNTHNNKNYHEIINLYYWNESYDDDIDEFLNDFYIDDKEDVIIINEQFERLTIKFEIA